MSPRLHGPHPTGRTTGASAALQHLSSTTLLAGLHPRVPMGNCLAVGAAHHVAHTAQVRWVEGQAH